MRSVFDTKAANFDPEQISLLSAAYDQALKAFEESDHPLPANTKAKLAKMIVNLGRERLRENLALDVKAISSEAADFLTQLRSLALLD